MTSSARLHRGASRLADPAAEDPERGELADAPAAGRKRAGAVRGAKTVHVTLSLSSPETLSLVAS